MSGKKISKNSVLFLMMRNANSNATQREWMAREREINVKRERSRDDLISNLNEFNRRFFVAIRTRQYVNSWCFSTDM